MLSKVFIAITLRQDGKWTSRRTCSDGLSWKAVTVSRSVVDVKNDRNRYVTNEKGARE